MNKIGILTYHNNNNRGAILQAYCLWRSLRKNIKESKVEIIDYRTLKGEIKRLYTINPLYLILKLGDFTTSTQFLRNQTALSPYKIVTDKHKKAINFLKNKNYDMIVVGSDQVWSVRKGKKFNRPFPNAYYLDPSLETLKVSYAPSANGMKLTSLSETEIKTYKKHISAFDKISVRDEHTEKLLENLSISGINRVPDPTILIDFPQNDLRKILSSNGISLTKPILAINQLKSDIGKPIINHYKKKGYQIVAPNYSRLADVNLFNKVNPLEYYSLHKYFDFVITGSLHTTIFSIKHGTPFATLDYSKNTVIDKVETLLEEFDFPDRHINTKEMDRNDILEKIKSCERELDEDQIERKLNYLKKKGFSYIQELGEMIDGKKV